MKKYSCVVWDWNGTLLDDVAVNIRTISTLLERRGLPLIPNETEYRGGFGFPIIDYYRTLGFDTEKESFSDIAEEYISVYNSKIKNARIGDGIREALEAIRGMDVRQVIISAAEQNRLRSEVRSYGIDGYFTDILGTGNNLGSSKVSVGKAFVASCGIPSEEILFIGDMAHDAEVAAECGCDVILVSFGHQSHERLEKLGAKVIESAKEIVTLLN